MGLHQYTYAEYAAFETLSTGKHEFLGGEIYALVNDLEEHSALAATMIGALANNLENRPYRVHTSDLRIFVESAGLATYGERVEVSSLAIELAVDEVYRNSAVR